MLRALPVEDHEDLADLTTRMLRDQDLVVAIATTADSALDMSMYLQPHLLLCDMNLPDMSGLALVEKLRASLALWGTYVVMVSARSSEQLCPYNVRAKTMGVNEFISKPREPAWVRALKPGWRIDRMSLKAGITFKPDSIRPGSWNQTAPA